MVFDDKEITKNQVQNGVRRGVAAIPNLKLYEPQWGHGLFQGVMLDDNFVLKYNYIIK